MPALRLLTWSLRALAIWLYYRYGWYRAAWKGVRAEWAARVSPHARIDGAASVGSATLGRDVTIGRGSYIASGIIQAGVIGDFCSLGPNLLIGPSEHDVQHWTTSPYESRSSGEPSGATNPGRRAPRIGNGVWIGANAVVLRGVTIGDRAIVAAGAVVVTDIPAGERWGGVPARPLGDGAGSPEPAAPESQALAGIGPEGLEPGRR